MFLQNNVIRMYSTHYWIDIDVRKLLILVLGYCLHCMTFPFAIRAKIEQDSSYIDATRKYEHLNLPPFVSCGDNLT